ncbi:hypothetical protein SCOR_34360 [Sulfidibacter corallicola]
MDHFEMVIRRVCRPWRPYLTPVCIENLPVQRNHFKKRLIPDGR